MFRWLWGAKPKADEQTVAERVVQRLRKRAEQAFETGAVVVTRLQCPLCGALFTQTIGSALPVDREACRKCGTFLLKAEMTDEQRRDAVFNRLADDQRLVELIALEEFKGGS